MLHYRLASGNEEAVDFKVA